MRSVKRVALIAAMAAGLLVPGIRSVAARQERPVEMATYVVRPGDSLWRIARRVDPSGDPRAFVDRLMDANRLSSPVLRIGQVLRLPAA